MFFVFVLGFAAGCLTAWNIWDQPKWLKASLKKIAEKLTS